MSLLQKTLPDCASIICAIKRPTTLTALGTLVLTAVKIPAMIADGKKAIADTKQFIATLNSMRNTVEKEG